MGRLLVTLATLLILLLAGASVAPAFMDWNAYRSDIERAASALMGRKIAIAGDIDIALLPEPHLHAKKVVAEGGASDAAQMTADAVDLTLSLQALFSGRVEASKLKLLNPYVILDLSKPLQGASELTKAGLTPPASGAEVTNLEIQGGRISIYPDAGKPEALILTRVDGTLAAPQRGNSYRFAGTLSHGDRRFDVKVSGTPQNAGVKLQGGATELKSKATIQADGVLNTTNAPVFAGTLAIFAPPAFAGTAFEVQAKAAAKLDRTGVALSDLILTLDAGERPQILTGSAHFAFAPANADFALEAHSLDADALLPGGGAPPGQAAIPDWDGVRNSADRLLWLYPDLGVHVSLAAEQIQLRGEPIEGVKVEATRIAQKWLFEDAQATLPGATAVRMTGALRNSAGKEELLARVAAEGKNLGRLNRWFAQPAAPVKSVAPRAFKAAGLLTLSDDVTAFTEAKGDVEGTSFKASVRFDKTPVRKLQISLAGDSFDWTGVEGDANGAISGEGVKKIWQGTLAQLAPVLGVDPGAFDTADVDISAGRLRTSVVEAKNVAVQLKFDRDMLNVTKLSLDAAEGLLLRGEGAVPMRNGAQGRFDGRLEASSPEAVVKLAALAGYGGDSMLARRADDLAPAVLTIAYSAQAQAANAKISGSLGVARIDGRVDLKGELANWRGAQISGQATISAVDGRKLAALLMSGSGEAAAGGASISPGTVAVRASGTPARLDSSVTVKTPPLQAQLDGIAKLDNAFSFSGKAQASSQEPERFLSPALFALLGGEPQTGLKVETALSFEAGRIETTKLRVESGKTLVSGRLAIGGADRMTDIDADLKADQLSLPSILSYVLAPSSSPVPAASPPIWSDRPFAMRAFQDTSAKIALAAKTLRLGDGLTLSDSQMSATLADGRLDIKKLSGKAFGGDVEASISLDGRGPSVAAATQISLSKADIAAVTAPGAPPLGAGKASLMLRASGQGLSPLGLLSVAEGKGVIALSNGQLTKISPQRVQRTGDELAAMRQPLSDDAIKKKVVDALQSADFKYRHLKIPLRLRNGMLEIPRASFRNKEGTVRMEAIVDLSTMQADTTWQAGVSSDRNAPWPPVKVQVSGQVRELGARPRVASAEDFARTLLVRKMEGDMTRLESLDKPQAPVATAAPQWATTQEAAPAPPQRRKQQPAAAGKRAGAVASGPTGFEKRMHDALTKAPPQSASQPQSQ